MRKLSFKNTMIVSFAVHIIVLAMLVFLKAKPLESFAPQAVTIEFEPQKKEDLTKMPDQIVQQDEKGPTEKSEDAKFLSARDQKVKKETVVKNFGQFQNTKTDVGAKSQTKAPAKTVQRKAGQKSLDKLLGGLKAEDFEAESENEQVEKPKPSIGTTAASQTDDYLKNVPNGTETLLNTKEFKYYTYYNRIRKQLAQHWEPLVKDKVSNLFSKGRSIASEQDHITKLMIILNEKGLLVKVQVLSESGIHDLDDAATEAFRAAAPFPNPPKGMIEEDGNVRIRWDFVLES